MTSSTSLSIILPSKNEARSLAALLPELKQRMPDAEIIVVDDGSSDDTVTVCEGHGVRVLSHPYCMGNGAAVKAGGRAASGDVLVFMDADGQHRPEDIPLLLEKLDQGFEMVVGARGKGSQASVHRSIGNRIYNKLASWMVGHRILDLTSGFRAVRARKFKQFLYLLPNGFSYPTTITMSFFRVGYGVAYVPIHAPKRIGESHLRLVRDGLRFLLIIFKIGSLYSPLKLFAPVALFHLLGGLGYYAYTFATQHRLSSMTVFLLSAAVTIFMIGLVSEQITALMYKDSAERE
ncbi:MAG: glycosyltransferase family 2 protein [Azonexus sp.]|nr:glycosyltransferase family 2 protein [Azonexus sp.]